MLEQDKLDQATAKVAEAEKSLRSAQNKSLKGIAEKKLKSVEKYLALVKEKDKENRFDDDLNQASSVIDEGKALMESESYRESIAKFEEAESLISSLSIAKEIDYFKRKEYDELTELEDGKRIYVVKLNIRKRDCLWRIAHKVYRNARLWPLIYMANRNKIKDPDLIFPGQRFIIPDVPEKKEDGGESKESTGREEADDNAIRPEEKEREQ
jgi:nucleoid-associated protein YgaU